MKLFEGRIIVSPGRRQTLSGPIWFLAKLWFVGLILMNWQ
jgi:hypothetical protein